MLTLHQKLAMSVVVFLLVGQIIRLVLAWRESRRIERIWRRHAAHSLTPRRHEDTTLHR